MAVSPRRVSKSRKGKRNSHTRIKDFHPLLKCLKCAKYIKFHTVCECGFYRNKKIF